MPQKVLTQDGSVPPCALRSLARGESLPGTASEALVWLLLEYPQAWGARVVTDNHLPDSVQATLADWLAAIPSARLLFIKRGRPAAGDPLRFFLVDTGDTNPRLYGFQLQSYNELGALDVPGLAAGEPALQSGLQSQPLFLVCTNGRRDPCCAREGQPVFQGLRRRWPEQAWQSSHVGGHRFAANLVCFPHGLFFGRLGVRQAAEAAEEYRQGRILLEHFRGRACYPPAVQAAEALLRERTGQRAVAALQLEGADERSSGRWQVVFRDAGSGTRHRMLVRVEGSSESLVQSCAGDKARPVVRYQLEEHRVG